MLYFYAKLHAYHVPDIDFSDGLPGYKHLEQATRIDTILAGLLKGHRKDVVYVAEFCDKVVRSLHDDAYVDFLLAISKELQGDEEYIPSIFGKNFHNSPLYFRGGMYSREIGTPIGEHTVKAALNAAHTALQAAEYMLQTNSSCFVLTRPPGHHAGKSRYGGYCFFNNAYLAAQKFVDMDKKVVIVDIDYHIGDGSMEFASKQMPYYSLHANVQRNYPYLESDFKNDNEYVHLMEFTAGMSGKEYVEHVEELLSNALKHLPETIILSLGFDTLGSDYCQDEPLCVSVEDFRTIGGLFGGLEQNVMIVLEGGYDEKNLELCAYEFISGFCSVQKRG